jgi:hypothetical protein
MKRKVVFNESDRVGNNYIFEKDSQGVITRTHLKPNSYSKNGKVFFVKEGSKEAIQGENFTINETGRVGDNIIL